MPLLKGDKAKSKKGVSKNISKSMKDGKPQKQAIAIAMTSAGKGKSGKKMSGKKMSKKKMSGNKMSGKKMSQKEAMFKRG